MMKIPVKVIKSYAGDELRPELPIAENTGAGEIESMKRKKDQDRLRSAAEEIPAALEREDQFAETAPESRTEAADSTDEIETPSGERPAVSRDQVRGDETALDAENLYLRLRADFENYKRHANAERERLAGLGKEMVLEDLFPLVEHLERALQAAKEGAAKAGPGESSGLAEVIIQGLEMVYRELLTVLTRHGLERIPTRGLPFDPALHEAVAAISRPGAEENTILEEVRPGFRRNGKLLRPAGVVVAK